jgi:nitronate monooxygenase
MIGSKLFTGVHGNYLAASIRVNGFDPKHLPQSDPNQMSLRGDRARAWKDIWGSGQGIGAVAQVQSKADRVAQLQHEYAAACIWLPRLHKK